MLDKIKKLIKIHGAVKIANDLGYRSTLAIQKWIKAKKIPDSAKLKVVQYLKGEKLK